MKKIDVLMATYNGERYIEEQIQSILNQTYTELNLIISDDNSKDDTVAIIKKIAKSDSRIQLIESHENIGYIRNFEKLISNSNADYIMFSDQDDVWLKEKIAESYKFFNETESDLIYTDLTVVDENLNLIHDSFNQVMKLHPEKIKSYNDLFHRNHGTGNTFLFSAEMKKYILPFIALQTKEYIHDWYILIECMYHGKVSYFNKSYILYRQHDANQIGLTKRNNSNDKFILFKSKRKRYIQTHFDFISELNIKYNDFNEYLRYLKSLQKTKFINFKFLTFLKYFRIESFIQQFKFLVVLHFPIIFCFVRK